MARKQSAFGSGTLATGPASRMSPSMNSGRITNVSVSGVLGPAFTVTRWLTPGFSWSCGARKYSLRRPLRMLISARMRYGVGEPVTGIVAFEFNRFGSEMARRFAGEVAGRVRRHVEVAA